jgi:hypothetical protein
MLRNGVVAAAVATLFATAGSSPSIAAAAAAAGQMTGRAVQASEPPL